MDNQEEKNEQVQVFLKCMGERMRQLRKKEFKNYEKFAFTHDISRALYGKYENGQDLRMSSFFKILIAYNVTPEEFFSEGFEAIDNKN